MDETLTAAYLRLLLNKSMGAKTLSALLNRFKNLSEVLELPATELKEQGLSSSQIDALFSSLRSNNADSPKVSDALQWQNNVERQIVLYESPAYPILLKQISSPPPVLFCHGNVSLLDEPGCAIVGSRNATSYGLRQAKWIANELGEAGFTIVSGLATGIDAAAHHGALAANANTIGVIGAGIDITYPRSNASLHDSLKNTGLVLSEFFPGTPPIPANFPRRNRIISGMSLGTVVVEASLRSGSWSPPGLLWNRIEAYLQCRALLIVSYPPAVISC